MKIIKHIPNSITSLNLFCGTVAVALSFYGKFEAALFCMIAAAIFDFSDGLAARLLKAYSPMGKELDSLADMVSFGVAPAMIAFNKMLQLWDMDLITIFSLPAGKAICSLLPLACTLLIAVFSALRLAKFNIDTRQTENFIGLATPACALTVGSLVYSMERYPQFNAIFEAHSYILPAIALLLSLLLVSEIPMFSFKFKDFSWKKNRARFSFLALTAVIATASIAASLNWSVIVLAVFVTYIAVNVASAIFHR